MLHITNYVLYICIYFFNMKNVNLNLYVPCAWGGESPGRTREEEEGAFCGTGGVRCEATSQQTQRQCVHVLISEWIVQVVPDTT